ncbi:hypothetical protein Tco_0014332, partial [Tanacetum coccineum]
IDIRDEMAASKHKLKIDSSSIQGGLQKDKKNYKNSSKANEVLQPKSSPNTKSSVRRLSKEVAKEKGHVEDERDSDVEGSEEADVSNESEMARKEEVEADVEGNESEEDYESYVIHRNIEDFSRNLFAEDFQVHLDDFDNNDDDGSDNVGKKKELTGKDVQEGVNAEKEGVNAKKDGMDDEKEGETNVNEEPKDMLEEETFTQWIENIIEWVGETDNDEHTMISIIVDAIKNMAERDPLKNMVENQEGDEVKNVVENQEGDVVKKRKSCVDKAGGFVSDYEW